MEENVSFCKSHLDVHVMQTPNCYQMLFKHKYTNNTAMRLTEEASLTTGYTIVCTKVVIFPGLAWHRGAESANRKAVRLTKLTG